MRGRVATWAAVVAIVAATAACGTGADPTTTPTEPGEPTPAASATISATPGEPVDAGPAQGDAVAVVGVAHDETLALRSSPGGTGDVLSRVGPVEADLVAAGESRRVDGSLWYLVTVDGRTGWVDGAHVQHLGDVDDVTSRVIELLGSTPVAATMQELGLVVARGLASADPESRITMTVDASVGDLGEVTYDVLGLGDDAIGGLRLHVFGTPSADGFVLKSVEQTTLCLRGVADGLCL